MIGTEMDQDRDQVIAKTIEFALFYIDKLGNVTGGSLHIVLSDGNLAYSDIQFCENYAEQKKDHVGVALARVLGELSAAEIQSVYEAVIA